MTKDGIGDWEFKSALLLEETDKFFINIKGRWLFLTDSTHRGTLSVGLDSKKLCFLQLPISNHHGSYVKLSSCLLNVIASLKVSDCLQLHGDSVTLSGWDGRH